ncbi:S-layer homology domain-containing protein [Metasolibacillus sp.]|uniref:S-layer homology domain-containing protein n=1 Tax=Metasolibacillus sp. TaxID=2703680 RepID=UPI0025F06E41|nr:S-layer homology domain-containing protein [Metasolibacillus sp.]MCT6923371.1 S-layer homology domain-containing protein [Metasolibacillus sp.]MCT6939906.1 S-layer homology domain-containing protein [Metasolibacillus sp.]
MKRGKLRKSVTMLAASALVISAVAPAMPVNVKADTQQVLTVTEVLANYDSTKKISNTTVRGYIVGYVNSETDVITTGPNVKDTNVAIAADPNETDTQKMLYIQLATGDRPTFSILQNPSALGKEIVLTGSLEKYFGSHAGIKSLTAIAFTGATVTPPDTPTIVPINNALTSPDGAIVTVQGRVTAKLKNTIVMQDETAGISVRPTSLNVQEGELVTITGKLNTYLGLRQLDSASVVSKDTAQIDLLPKVIAANEVGEDYESQLVEVQNIKLSGGANGNYTATDGSNTFIVRDENNSLSLLENVNYASIVGIVQQYNNDYQIIPRSVADVTVDPTVLLPPVATPAGGTFIGGTTVKLTATTANAEILYTLDDVDPKIGGATYASPINITEDTTLKAVVKRGDISSPEYSDVITIDYKIVEALRIHDIQGAAHTTKFNNQMVEGVKGIITSSYEVSGAKYYTIQTPDAEIDNNPYTSEGIVLYAGKTNWPIEVGDLVSVTGKVSEYAIEGYTERQTTDLLTTQISVRDDQGGKVTVVEKNVPLPTPIIIDENNLPTGAIDSDNLTVFNPETDAIDFWESLEGMRVQVSNVKAVGPQANGDLTTVLESKATNTKNGGVLLQKDNKNPDIIQFRLEPNGDARKFAVATGDKFVGDIVGVVGYSYQNYKIYAPLTDMKAAFVKGSVELEKTHIVKDPTKLTVGSYNLENFSNNKSKTSDDKAQKLARAFVKDLNSPDIVGVTEVQDNDGDINNGNAAANESYERLINEIVKAGGVEYKYANIDPINNTDGGAPGANIRVGVLYNPERVQLSDITAGDATTAVGYENGNLTVNPGRIDPQNDAFKSSRKPLAAQFNFNGEQVIIIVNHWNSKNGDDALYGSKQPVVNKSEVQRKNIATIVEGFINDVKTKNPKANIVAVGDFNDFQFADSVKILENRHMTNMINHLPEEDRYSYVFQGNSQVLDHILVSNNLAKATEIDAIHINADFTDMAGRASDHDPILAQIDVKAANTEPNPDGGNNPGNGGSNPGNGGGNNSGGGNAGGGTTAPETKPEEKPETEKPETPQPEEQEKPAPFTPTDVPANHWAAGYIEKMIEKGLLKGNEKGEVKPDANVTRAQFASILARALSLKADGQAPFSDVSKYAPATQAEIAAIFEAGIAKGVDGQFNPSGETTRAQFALMLYRAYEHVTGEKYTPKGDATFSDLGQYNEETRAAIAMIQELGIATGDNGKFKPTAPATRAHTAKMVINFLEVIESR